MGNIQTILTGDIAVNIRLNVSPSNGSDMIKLVEEIGKRFEGKEHLKVYAHPLFEGEGNPPLKLSDIEREALYQSYSEIQNKIFENGLGQWPSLKQTRVCNCMADNLRSVVITPEGNLGLCEHHSEDEYIGSIYNSKLDVDTINEWNKLYYTSECADCVIYPQCTKIAKCAISNCTEAERTYLKKRIRDLMLVSYKDYLIKEEAL